MRHIIACLVENRAGVLAHVAGLFSSRGFNIESLCVSPTQDPSISRMTITTSGDEAVLEQIRKQLGKLIPVLKVTDFSAKDFVERDLMLIKVSAPASQRPHLMALVEVFRAKIVDVSPNHMVIEISGQKQKIDAFIELLKEYGIRELARSGSLAMLRGK